MTPDTKPVYKECICPICRLEAVSLYSDDNVCASAVMWCEAGHVIIGKMQQTNDATFTKVYDFSE